MQNAFGRERKIWFGNYTFCEHIKTIWPFVHPMIPITHFPFFLTTKQTPCAMFTRCIKLFNSVTLYEFSLHLLKKMCSTFLAHLNLKELAWWSFWKIIELNTYSMTSYLFQRNIILWKSRGLDIWYCRYKWMCSPVFY